MSETGAATEGPGSDRPVVGRARVRRTSTASGGSCEPWSKGWAAASQVFDVPATAGQPWFDSGIDLETGEEASITASGKVHYCDNCAGKPGMPSNDVGPDGFDQGPADSDFLVPSLPAHSLIGRVGSGAAVFVAKGPTIVKGRGRLRFAFNDNLYSDNSGAFHVTVTTHSNPVAPSSSCASGPSVLLWTNSNTGAVSNGPGGRPAFTLSSAACITQVVTYHWNNGRGAAPGTISIQRAPSTGPIVGTFQAQGTPGQNNVRNANWVANISPPLELSADNYSIVDSDEATWSRNSQSAFRGFAAVYGKCADGSTDCASRAEFKISPPDLRGQWVCSGPCQKPGGIGSITGVGPSLTLINEVGQKSTAYFADRATIVARDWGGYGKVSGDLRVITWANNTVWTRSGGSSGAGPVFPPGPAPKPVACTLRAGFQFDCYGQVLDVSPKPIVLGGTLTVTVNPKSGYSFDGHTAIILEPISGVGLGVGLRTLCGGLRGGAPNTPCPLSGPKSMTLSVPDDGSIPTGYYILRAENWERSNVVGGAGASTPKSTKADSDQVKFIK